MTPAAATGSMNLRPIRLCGSHEGRAQAHRRQVSRWSPARSDLAAERPKDADAAAAGRALSWRHPLGLSKGHSRGFESGLLVGWNWRVEPSRDVPAKNPTNGVALADALGWATATSPVWVMEPEEEIHPKEDSTAAVRCGSSGTARASERAPAPRRSPLRRRVSQTPPLLELAP
jgi:hypothetical protein